jgi:hypothetical protein
LANEKLLAEANGKEKGSGILHLPALERSSGYLSDRGVRRDDIDPRQPEKPGRDKGGANRRSIYAPQGLLAACQALGSMFDVDAYIVDQRTPQLR